MCCRSCKNDLARPDYHDHPLHSRSSKVFKQKNSIDSRPGVTNLAGIGSDGVATTDSIMMLSARRVSNSNLGNNLPLPLARDVIERTG